MNYERLENFKNIKVLVLGDFMLDRYITGDVIRISPEAPVPVVNVKKKAVHLGGAGNVINNIVALSASVRVVSCIGKDEAGDYLIKRMNEKGVDTKFIWQKESGKTSVKTRVVAKGQQFLRYDEESVEDVCQEYIKFIENNLDEVFDDIDIVIISDYGKGNITFGSAQALIQKARIKNVPVIVDPKGSDYKKYSGATACTPNMNEFRQVMHESGALTEKEIAIKAKKLCESINLDCLLITRSEQGMSLVKREDGKKDDYSAVAQEVIDVTGAGDTVISVFSLAIAAGMDMSEACKLANDAASIVISKFGAAVASLEEIKSLGYCGGKTKLVSLEQIIKITKKLKESGKKIVFTNGCFDLVHAGHISSFTQAKDLGDILIVGINSDVSVKRIKGEKRPIVDQVNRARLLSALNMIDYIVIFEEDTPERLVQAIVPHTLVKGRDWAGKTVVGQEVVEKNGGEVCLINLEEGLSTTSIIEKVRALYH